jgi:aminoglycoside 3-N-acetyltransferase
MLTEHFRRAPGVRRTAEPIFSCGVRGRLPDEWEGRLFVPRDIDCFGADSVFALLHEADAKLLFFGVDFEFCTFVYRVEQQLGVPYRYMKGFRGDVVAAERRTPVTARYFVRDLDAGVENAFLPLAAELSARGLLGEHRIARGPRMLCCTARDVYDVAVEKVHEQPDYLLTRGHAEALAT